MRSTDKSTAIIKDECSHGVCHVALASDLSYYVGLKTAIKSIVTFNKDLNLCIHILEDGFSEELKSELKESLRKVSNSVELMFYPVDVSHFLNLHDLRGSKMQYARLLIPSLIKVPKIIYLDCDLLVFSGLKELWNIDLRDTLAGVVQDAELPMISGDWPMDDEAPDAKYFNSGVMLINLVGWRENDIQSEVLNLLDEKCDKCVFWDQTALNVVLLNKVKYLDHKFNFCPKYFKVKSSKPVILHYMSRDRIPWESLVINDSYKIWNYFYKHNVDSVLLRWNRHCLNYHYWKSLFVRLRVSNILFYSINRTLLKLRGIFCHLPEEMNHLQNKASLYGKRRVEYLEFKKTKNNDLKNFLIQMKNSKI